MSRAKSIGNVYAELAVRDKMSMGLQRAGRALSKFNKQAVGMGSRALAAGVAAASATLIVGTKRTLAMGAELDHLSTQTGMAVTSLMKLGQAYKDNGKDAKSVSKDVGKMQKVISGSADGSITDDPIAKLGMSAKDLMKLSPEDQFFKIGQAIAAIENPAERTARAMEIFGKGGAGLITVFKGSNLDDVNASLGRMPMLMQKFSKEMERADTLLGRLPNKSDQFFVGFTAGIVGHILPGLEEINKKDFTELGENLGRTIGRGVQSLRDGTFWEVVGLRALAWAIDVGKYITSVFGAAFEVVFDKAKNTFKDMMGGFAMILGNDAGKEKYFKEFASRENKTFEQSYDAKMREGSKNADFFRQMADEIWNNQEIQTVGDDIGKSIEEAQSEDLAESQKPRTQSWESASAQVSDMQSRGLSYGREGIPNLVKDQAAAVKGLFEMVKTAINKGDIIFTGA